MPDGADRVALLCVRNSRRFGLQVLLRSEAAATDAGKDGVSFPEGKVEERDYAAATLKRCRGLTAAEAQHRLGRDMGPARALGFWTAGARVLLSATGVLFGVAGTQRAPAVLRARSGLKDTPDLGAFMERRALHCDLSRLLFFAKWVNPGSGAARTFLLVQLPERARAAGFAWHVPEKALLHWRDRALPLDFHTFACLRVLTDFSSCDSLLAEYAVR